MRFLGPITTGLRRSGLRARLRQWWRCHGFGLSRGAGRFGTPRPSPMRPAAGKRPLLVLEPGDRVTHDKYGLGRVEEVSGVGESAMSLIDFGSAGRVKLMHNHAPVAKL